MWGKSRANTFSLWGRRGDRLYCSVNSYNMGEGKTIKVWFSCSYIPIPSLVLSALSSLGQNNYHSYCHCKDCICVGSGDDSRKGCEMQVTESC